MTAFETISEVISRQIKGENVLSISPIQGGSINKCFIVSGLKNLYFLKICYNAPKDFHEKEAKGLDILAKTKIPSTPRVYGYGHIENKSFLLQEYIKQAPLHKGFWKTLGEQLANLHRITAAVHGLDHNNYIGMLPQKNVAETGAVDFFKNARLIPQIEMASKNGVLERRDIDMLYMLVNRLDQMLPEGKPSLIHGDLWHGNVISDGRGNPVFIDPAVSFSNREMEIAFTKLFGGFSDEFYDSYQNENALAKDFEKRVDIYNLYPLLVHLNIFGKRYLPQIRQILKNHS